MKAVKIKTAVVGKDSTKGLQTPRFRLHSGNTNPSELMVAHYGVSPRFVNQQPDVEVTNVYKVLDILMNTLMSTMRNTKKINLDLNHLQTYISSLLN